MIVIFYILPLIGMKHLHIRYCSMDTTYSSRHFTYKEKVVAQTLSFILCSLGLFLFVPLSQHFVLNKIVLLLLNEATGYDI